MFIDVLVFVLVTWPIQIAFKHWSKICTEVPSTYKWSIL